MNQTSIASTVKSFNGDSVSPILIYRRLKGNHKFLMESSRQFQGSGEYTYLGSTPIKSFIIHNNQVREINHLTSIEEMHYGEPFEVLNRLVRCDFDHLPFEFSGGLVGHATYESLVQHDQKSECEIDLPCMQFDLYDTMIVYCHHSDEVKVIHHEIERTYEEAKVDDLIGQIFQGEKETTQPFHIAKFESHTSEKNFKNIVQRAKLAIEQGEAVQLFLTNRFSAPFTGDSFTMYRYLRKELPAPNMFYFQYPQYTIMGVAPDSIMKVKGKRVFVTPVTGARPRGGTPREDVKVELTLLQNSREVNAHNILVDCTMSDLEKICLAGTIHLTDYMKPMQFKHSIRLTTEIEGLLKENLKPLEALSVLMPPAASSGVPKKQAAMLVQSIEEIPRSFSGGIIGYVSFNGNLSFTQLQQAMVVKNNYAYIQAGANILQDTMEMDAILEIKKKLKAFLNIE